MVLLWNSLIFWQDISIFLLRSLNNGFDNNELSTTQKEGIITCIPKSNKDRKYLKKKNGDPFHCSTVRIN